MKVLIVEDDRVAAGYLCNALRESGHVADVVEDGGQGLQRALYEPYDALIVDRMLPGLDGLSLIGRLRSEGRLPECLRERCARPSMRRKK